MFKQSTPTLDFIDKSKQKKNTNLVTTVGEKLKGYIKRSIKKATLARKL